MVNGLDFDDPEWARLHGGYRAPYDPRAALRALEHGQDTERAWTELWNKLHHQGDVGEASYAAVPHLVRIHAARGVADWNTYALAAVIEMTRHADDNPALPEHLRDAYEASWRQLVNIGLRELGTAQDPELVSSIIAVVAIGKGQPSLGRFAFDFTEDERLALLADADR